MAKIVGFFKTLRNHWKKSTFAVLLFAYGADYGHDKYLTHQLIKSYCLEAKKYGDQPQAVGAPSRHVTVVLNPAANGGKAKKEFEEYCAPLLYLSGMKVSVVKTETVGEARGLLEYMDNTDGVVVAGGDGALSEAVTGLLRRADAQAAAQRFPIGVVPVGKTNRVARSLFRDHQDDRIKLMAEATMTVVRNLQRPVDVMKVQVVDEAATPAGKAIYAVGRFQWGAFRDAEERAAKYWLLGPLKPYAAYLFSVFRDLTWQCAGRLGHTPPCDGCRRCRSSGAAAEGVGAARSPLSSRWWHVFLPRTTASASNSAPAKDYSNVVNEKCGQWDYADLSTVELQIVTENSVEFSGRNEPKHLQISIGPEKVSSLDFIGDGWRRVGGRATSLPGRRIAARQLSLQPAQAEAAEEIKEEDVAKGETEAEGEDKAQKEVKEQLQPRWYAIDNDSYEVKPIHVTLLPDAVRVFAPPPRLAA